MFQMFTIIESWVCSATSRMNLKWVRETGDICDCSKYHPHSQKATLSVSCDLYDVRYPQQFGDYGETRVGKLFLFYTCENKGCTAKKGTPTICLNF